VPLALSATSVERLLGGRTETWWINGDILTVAARRENGAELCCAVAAPLHPIGPGLQAVSVRIPDIDSAILDVVVLPPVGALNIEPVWRGPNAPPAPPRADAAAVEARTYYHAIDSAALGEQRGFSVYVPEGIRDGERVPVIYMPDGGWPNFYRIADAMARNGRAGKVIMVGIAEAARPSGPRCRERYCDLRSQELLIDLPGAPPGETRFDRRARFTLEEVIPFVESHYPVRRDPAGRAVLGWSNGGAWALTMGALHPDLFGNVIALSVGWEGAVRRAPLLRHGRAMFAVGRFEDEEFRGGTARAAELARQAGADVRLRILPGGHAHSSWELAVAEALAWMFPPAR
jgi:enterochelin esterase-like enzyme